MKPPLLAETKGIYGIPHRDVPHGFFAEIIITGARSDVRLRCDPNTDELLVSHIPKNRKRGVSILSGKYRVNWTWMMENQQGYNDGLRIQVSTSRKTLALEFIVAASMIQVYQASEWQNKLVLPPPGRVGRP